MLNGQRTAKMVVDLTAGLRTCKLSECGNNEGWQLGTNTNHRKQQMKERTGQGKLEPSSSDDTWTHESAQHETVSRLEQHATRG